MIIFIIAKNESKCVKLAYRKLQLFCYEYTGTVSQLLGVLQIGETQLILCRKINCTSIKSNCTTMQEWKDSLITRLVSICFAGCVISCDSNTNPLFLFLLNFY